MRVREGLALRSVIGQSAGVMGPEASVGLATTVVAAKAGGATPLTYLVAGVGVFALAYVVSRYARLYRGAGAFSDYVGNVAHPRLGIFTGWTYATGLGVFGMTGGTLASAIFLQALIQQVFSFHIGWGLLAIAIFAVIVFLAYREVRVPTNVLFGFMVCGVISVAAVCTVVLVKVPHISFSALTLAPSPTGFSGLTGGLVFAVLSFVGFESAAPLAEETKDPQRLIPRGLMLVVALVGAFYVYCSFAMVQAYGLENTAESWGTDPTPILTMADKYTAAWVGDITLLVVALSWAAIALGAATASSRVVHAMARDGHLHHLLSRTSKHDSPHVALATIAGVGAAVTVILLIAGEPVLTIFTVELTAIAIALFVVYLVLALVAYRLQNRSRAFVVAVPVSVVVVGLGLYGSLIPFPSGALMIGPFAALAILLTAVVVAITATTTEAPVTAPGAPVEHVQAS
jgi:amino acid transporter